MVGTKGQLNVTIVKKQMKTKKTQSYHSDDLTLPMLRLHSSKAQGRKTLWKSSKPCHIGMH